MRRILSLLINLLVIQIAIAQSPCLPDGISFTTQAQIDSFQINYPGCTEIEGQVYINSEDISNLNGLSQISAIGGHLKIFQKLKNKIL